MTNQNSTQSELIIALVTPAGVRRADLIEGLDSALKSVGFNTVTVKLSELLEQCIKIWMPQQNPGAGERIKHLQVMGNAFRKQTNQGDGAALARASIAAIREKRMEITGNPDMPAGRTAFILDQLKHPSEVELLREVYGSCFFLVAGHAPEKMRRKELAEDIARKDSCPEDIGSCYRQADELIENDDNQEDDFGQKTRNTYPLADIFIDLSSAGTAKFELGRFIDLIFGHPFWTPRPEEYAMYQANAVSLRSSDESRQVGAAVATLEGDVVAVGANEVPIRGGGLYWPGESPDSRDQELARKGENRAQEIKVAALRELLERLSTKKWLIEDNTKSMKDRAIELLPSLKGTQFINIGEFGRTVHAEMASLIDAARRGVSVDKRTMYVTTFPCHNCAKHIIAAGIAKVVYLEPYPKSRAKFLHGEEIELDPELGREYRKNHNQEEILTDKVIFVRFSGVAPRQYHQLFSMTSRGAKAKKGHALNEWNSKRTTLLPRYVVRNASNAYLAAEREELEKLPGTDFKWEKNDLCPMPDSSLSPQNKKLSQPAQKGEGKHPARSDKK